MKSLLSIVTFIMTMLLVNSCRKNNVALFDGVTCTGSCYILAGKLIDSATTGAIAHGELKFYFEDIRGTFSSKKIYLGKATTDMNGNYTFRFNGSQFKNIMGYYYIEAFSGNMFGGDLTYPNRVTTFDLDTSFYNLQFIQNLPLFRPATVKVRVVASAVTNFQFLTVDYSYGKVGNGIVFNGGRSIDTTIIWKTAGDLPTVIQTDAVGNGVNIHKRDTLIIPTNNTRQIEIRL